MKVYTVWSRKTELKGKHTENLKELAFHKRDKGGNHTPYTERVFANLEEARAYYEGLKDDCKSYIYFGYTYVMECGIDETTYDTEEDYLNKDWRNYEELEFYTGTIKT
jgi:hypothetical protein